MTKKFKELRDKMSPEARAKVEATLAKICIAKPLFDGSSFYEFSCGSSAFVPVDAPSFPNDCPFCLRPLNRIPREDEP